MTVTTQHIHTSSKETDRLVVSSPTLLQASPTVRRVVKRRSLSFILSHHIVRAAVLFLIATDQHSVIMIITSNLWLKGERSALTCLRQKLLYIRTLLHNH